MRLDGVELIGGDQRVAELRDRLIDPGHHGVDLGGVLDDRVDHPQAGVAGVRGARFDALDQLLVEHQRAVDGAGLTERELGQRHRGDEAAVARAEGAGLVAHQDLRLGLALVGDLDPPLGLLFGLGADLRRLVAGLPRRVMLLDQREGRVGVDVAGDDDHAIVGAIVATEELARILVLGRHRLDVLDQAHRGVTVGVDVVGRLAQGLVGDEEGARAVLAVFAIDRAGLGLEPLFVIVEVHEAIGLELDDGREVVAGDVELIDGHVGRGVGVGVGAQASHDFVVEVGGVLLGPAEHHVFEEVGEAGRALLVLVAGAGSHDRAVGDQARGRGRDHDDLQPIGEGLLRPGVGEELDRPALLGGSALHELVLGDAPGPELGVQVAGRGWGRQQDRQDREEGNEGEAAWHRADDATRARPRDQCSGRRNSRPDHHRRSSEPSPRTSITVPWPRASPAILARRSSSGSKTSSIGIGGCSSRPK